jgi:hypothetical protein
LPFAWFFADIPVRGLYPEDCPAVHISRLQAIRIKYLDLVVVLQVYPAVPTL